MERRCPRHLFATWSNATHERCRWLPLRLVTRSATAAGETGAAISGDLNEMLPDELIEISEEGGVKEAGEVGWRGNSQKC